MYVKTVLTLGDKPSPAMAQIAFKMTAEEVAIRMLPRSLTITHTLMIFVSRSAHTVDEAKQLTKKTDKVLESAGFRVKGWLSNEKIEDAEVINPSESQPIIKLLQGSAEEKLLGVVWNHQQDVFAFKVHPPDELTLTKITVLINIARLFQRNGGNFFKEMEALNHVTFEKCLTPDNVIGASSLIVFADASNQAFGACAYVRWETSDRLFVTRFVTAKSRIAPLIPLTIPRMELQAAVLAVHLARSILDETRTKFEKVILFSNCSIVISWIHNHAREFKPFVSARIAEIQSKPQPCQWRHIHPRTIQCC